MGPEQQYLAFLREGRFMIQRAPGSGRHVFYPRVAEPGTGAALDWVPASGRGVVYSSVVVHRRPPEPNYNIALIDLDEGPRMLSRVEGITPEAVRIGMAVRARIVEQGELPLVVFEPAGPELP